MNQFTAVPLDTDKSGKSKKNKVPRRILHFSDGTLEEYSSDEEDCKDSNKELMDPKTLQWLPWFMYYISTGAKKSLSVADFCGEKLAWFFGITSPKYGYAIAEHNRLQKEFSEDQANEKRDLQGYSTLSSVNIQVVDGKNGSSDVKVINNAPSSVEPKY